MRVPGMFSDAMPRMRREHRAARRALIPAVSLVLVAVLSACGGGADSTTPTAGPAATTVPVDPLSVVNAYYEAFNAGDVGGLSATLAENVVLSIDDLQVRGRSEVLANHLASMAQGAQITLSSPSVRGDTVRGGHTMAAEGFRRLTGTTKIVVGRDGITSLEVTTEQPAARGAPVAGRLDPAFEALEGAQAHFGELEGALYQIELPDEWNGRLVLWAHGARDPRQPLSANPPSFREFLIQNGTAWAASSFSANGDVMFQAAHETAALQDFFSDRFGEPRYSYITGNSMGGHITLLSLELFPDRYDGALASCSVVGLATLDYPGHYVVLGAYAAGVTQEEFDSADSMVDLARRRIIPVLATDLVARDLFEGLVTALTGGPRPFRDDGFEATYGRNFLFADAIFRGRGTFDNTGFEYPASPDLAVTAEEVNAGVVRFAGNPEVRNANPNYSDFKGDVPVPLLMMHTTGDPGAPFHGMQAFRRLADAAGNGDMLVQRAVRSPFHCDFSDQEMGSSLTDLFQWVEKGVKPEGEEVLGPLDDIGREFTDPLRPGDPGGL